MNNIPVSAVIIARNEERIIGKTIAALKNLTNDIIVVDALSEDNTKQLAIDSGARVFSKKWTGFGAAKNYGNEQALHDWILSIDADEVIDDTLIQAIGDADLSAENNSYLINIKTSIAGKWVNHSGWFPLWRVRLFHRKNAKWNLAKVHEQIIYDKKPSFVKLNGLVKHYSYPTFESHRRKMESYARLAALEWKEKGYHPSQYKRIFGPSFRFIKAFVFKRGFLDGRIGWYIAQTNAELIRLKLKYFDELK